MDDSLIKEGNRLPSSSSPYPLTNSPFAFSLLSLHHRNVSWAEADHMGNSLRRDIGRIRLSCESWHGLADAYKHSGYHWELITKKHIISWIPTSSLFLGLYRFPLFNTSDNCFFLSDHTTSDMQAYQESLENSPPESPTTILSYNSLLRFFFSFSKESLNPQAHSIFLLYFSRYFVIGKHFFPFNYSYWYWYFLGNFLDGTVHYLGGRRDLKLSTTDFGYAETREGRLVLVGVLEPSAQVVALWCIWLYW